MYQKSSLHFLFTVTSKFECHKESTDDTNSWEVTTPYYSLTAEVPLAPSSYLRLDTTDFSTLMMYSVLVLINNCVTWNYVNRKDSTFLEHPMNFYSSLVRSSSVLQICAT